MEDLTPIIGQTIQKIDKDLKVRIAIKAKAIEDRRKFTNCKSCRIKNKTKTPKP